MVCGFMIFLVVVGSSGEVGIELLWCGYLLVVVLL